MIWKKCYSVIRFLPSIEVNLRHKTIEANLTIIHIRVNLAAIAISN